MIDVYNSLFLLKLSCNIYVLSQLWILLILNWWRWNHLRLKSIVLERLLSWLSIMWVRKLNSSWHLIHVWWEWLRLHLKVVKPNMAAIIVNRRTLVRCNLWWVIIHWKSSSDLKKTYAIIWWLWARKLIKIIWHFSFYVLNYKINCTKAFK